MTYERATYNSDSRLKRFSHRKRFEFAMDMVVSRGYRSILDYGCGDGHFLEMLEGTIPNAMGYEPRSDGSNPRIRPTLNAAEQVDCITCLEVLEHLNEAQQDEFFNACRLLAPKGTAIISVPIMIGASGFLKILIEMRRMARDRSIPNRNAYSWRNALSSLIGRPSSRRWPNRAGVFHHIGFDHRQLRLTLESKFRSVEVVHCPFKNVPYWLNSQVFYICKDPQ